MKIAGDIATEKNLWSKEHSLRQDHLIESYGLPTQTPKIKKNKVITILMGDKKYVMENEIYITHRSWRS